MTDYSRTDCESGIIGTLLHDRGNSLPDVAFLQPEDFNGGDQRAAFDAITTMRGGIDSLTVSVASGVPANILREWELEHYTFRHLVEYAKEVKRMSHKRALSLLASRTIRRLEAGDDVYEVMESTEGELFDVARDRIAQKHPAHIGPLAYDAVEHFKKLAAGEITRGHKTGLSQLDALLGGFRPAELAIIAGRPGCGKTAYLLNTASALIGAGVPVLMFSLEMTDAEQARRIVQLRAELEIKRVMTGGIYGESQVRQAEQAAEKLSGEMLHIDDHHMHTISSIRTAAIRWASKNSDGVVIIDYLQIINAAKADSKQPRHVQIATMSMGLKQLAKELKCPVIAACQIGRGGEKESASSKLSHLRESGSIEQDADAVIILEPPPDEAKEALEKAGHHITVCLAKNRNGQTGEFWARFHKETQRICDSDFIFIPQQKTFSGKKSLLPSKKRHAPLLPDDVEYDEEII